jgi:hypothetical protein
MASGTNMGTMNRIGRNFRTVLLIVLYGICSPCLIVTSPSSVYAQDFFSSLAKTKTVAWSQQPLVAVLESFGQAIEIPIWLDRRADPTKLVDLQTTAEWHQIVEQIAKTCDLQAVAVPKLFVVARREDADRIASSVLATRKLLSSTPGFSKLSTQSQKVEWPLLAQPQQIAQYIAQQWKCEIDHEGLPHDLWRKSKFARVDGATLLALLGASFDRVPVVRGERISWEEMPTRIQSAQRYSVKPGTHWEDQVRQADPLAKVTRVGGGSIELVATAAGHQVLALSQIAKPPKPDLEAPYEINLVNQPATAVVKMLARTKGWEIRWPSGSEPTDAKLVSFRKLGTVPEFLDETCQQAGWQWKIMNNILTIGVVPSVTDR